VERTVDGTGGDRSRFFLRLFRFGSRLYPSKEREGEDDTRSVHDDCSDNVCQEQLQFVSLTAHCRLFASSGIEDAISRYVSQNIFQCGEESEQCASVEVSLIVKYICPESRLGSYILVHLNTNVRWVAMASLHLEVLCISQRGRS
jgi:hypothetical protein